MRVEILGLPPESDRLRLSFPATPAARPRPGEAGALLSLRPSGDMGWLLGAKAPARVAFLEALGLDPAQVRGTELHHTRRVLHLSPNSETSYGRARPGEPLQAQDGFLVDPGLGIGVSVTVADCMPIWILDRSSGAYGVLHSGWKGTGILATAVAALGAAYGSHPADLAVILGPAIGPCCYPVDPERARGFEAEFGSHCVVRMGDTVSLDLRAANLSLAESLGIGALSSVEACTSCEPRLGSYRREGKASFTRMLAYCGPLPGPSP